jgi:hypothetical protein
MLACEPSALEPQIGPAADLFPAWMIFRPRLPPMPQNGIPAIFFSAGVKYFTLAPEPQAVASTHNRWGGAPWGCMNGACGFLWPARNGLRRRRFGKNRRFARYADPQLGASRRVTEPGRRSAVSTRWFGPTASEHATRTRPCAEHPESWIWMNFEAWAAGIKPGDGVITRRSGLLCPPPTTHTRGITRRGEEFSLRIGDLLWRRNIASEGGAKCAA